MGISLQDVIGGNLLEGIKGIISEFHASPEDKLKLQELLDQNAEQLREREIEWDEKLNDVAGQNIRQDSSSPDPWVRRARPFFLWVITAALAVNLLVFPLINVLLHKGLVYPEIPAPIMELFGVAFLGYTTARTVEKVKGQD